MYQKTRNHSDTGSGQLRNLEIGPTSFHSMPMILRSLAQLSTLYLILGVHIGTESQHRLNAADGRTDFRSMLMNLSSLAWLSTTYQMLGVRSGTKSRNPLSLREIGQTNSSFGLLTVLTIPCILLPTTLSVEEHPLWY